MLAFACPPERALIDFLFLVNACKGASGSGGYCHVYMFHFPVVSTVADIRRISEEGLRASACLLLRPSWLRE